MTPSACLVMSALMAVNLTIAPVVADSDSGKAPTFTKGKFAVPISHENVKQDWAARGYSNPKIESYPQGWSRGEHTHPVSLIMTLLTGRMEFTFGTQEFILEPGDELSYPANTVHSAKNISDGVTQMMSSYKYGSDKVSVGCGSTSRGPTPRQAIR
jgi:mannose-6-phosphate isomerase-like protein (cupin superfamily)